MRSAIEDVSPIFGTSQYVPSFSGNRLRRELKWLAHDLGLREDRIDVARVSPEELSCVFYLYPDADSARNGMKVGGTGFWISVVSQNVPNFLWLFAVSNRHVVYRDGASILRVNAPGGGFKIFESEPTDWVEHPSGHDIVICPIMGAQVLPHIDCISIPFQMFAIEQHIRDETIGIGDDVYMIGRFINHEGKERNMPSVRFGNISMLPGEPIYIDKDTKPQESFAVELRSMCGYSGSPVFVEIGGIQHRRGSTTMEAARQLFLGVHWGHIIEPWIVEHRIVKTGQQAGLRPGEKEIEQIPANTGMNGVVPAWRLREMLELPRIKEIQRRDEEYEVERRKRISSGAKLDSAAPDVSAALSPVPDDDANPNHLADFTRLVDVAARKRPQDDQT